MLDDIFDDSIIDDEFIENCSESFFQNVGSLIGATQGSSYDEINELLISNGKDKDEREMISIICGEVDTEHKLMADLKNSNLDSGVWLERFVEKSVKDYFPNASDEEIEEVKIALKSNTEIDISRLWNQLEKDKFLPKSFNDLNKMCGRTFYHE